MSFNANDRRVKIASIRLPNSPYDEQHAPKGAMMAHGPETTIYHNPNCGTSRRVLGMLQDAGITPHVIEYLKTPPSRTDLVALLQRMGIGPRQLLRRKGTPYEELDLDDTTKTDEMLIDAILAHPILMERPVVVTAKGAKICRPAEEVNALIA
jgi:arsenate reductase (glutaredoxin)